MKILQIHNKYQLSGGEDTVVENERRLLESKGHSVVQYIKDNKEINKYSFLKKANLFNESVFSNKSYNEIKEVLKREKPGICHVHNYMPLISPVVFYACNEMKVPVIQTLHNYRMLCTNAYLFRDGKVCEECIGKSLYNSVKYGCYRNSRAQTFAVARMIEIHKKKGTWAKIVDAYISLTNFSKRKFIEGGIPYNKIYIKPNFIFCDPGKSLNNENYFLFAGRLEIEKGIKVLINALEKLQNKICVKIAGDGSFKNDIIANRNVTFLGLLKNEELLVKIKESRAIIFSSVWFEGMPMIIIEAFACGKPVIASSLGAVSELIENGKTGLLFEPGNPVSLAAKIDWAQEHPEEMYQMGLNARKEYEKKYTAQKNYEILMEIYEKVLN